MRKNNTFLSLLSLILVSLFISSGTLQAKTRWVGTWATAPQLVETHNNPPQPGLTNNSLRQVVRVSIGGKILRVKLSNEHSKSAVTVKSAQVAASKGGGVIDVTTNKTLTFNGKKDITLAAGAVVYSDPISFKLTPRMDVAITLYLGETSADVTGHPGSRTTSYIIKGNDPAVTDFTGAVTTDHWYIINGIDVKASGKTSAVAIIGNSITDGRGSTTNQQNRWPDILSERLLKNKKTSKIGVLNMGIGGNCVLAGGLGPTAVVRYERDILNQAGVRWAIVYEGINDIGNLPNNETAATNRAKALIDAYKQMIEKAHAKGITIYGATIMPVKGNGYYGTYREVCRNAVNEWIRTSGAFDGVIDFDKAMQDPADAAKIKDALQDDYLHPNVAGHKTMGDFVDLSLFTN